MLAPHLRGCPHSSRRDSHGRVLFQFLLAAILRTFAKVRERVFTVAAFVLVRGHLRTSRRYREPFYATHGSAGIVGIGLVYLSDDWKLHALLPAAFLALG